MGTKFMGGIGCFIVAMDCGLYAKGTYPQNVFTGDAMWMWWLFAIIWAGYGIANWIRD